MTKPLITIEPFSRPVEYDQLDLNLSEYYVKLDPESEKKVANLRKILPRNRVLLSYMGKRAGCSRVVFDCLLADDAINQAMRAHLPMYDSIKQYKIDYKYDLLAIGGLMKAGNKFVLSQRASHKYGGGFATVHPVGFVTKKYFEGKPLKMFEAFYSQLYDEGKISRSEVDAVALGMAKDEHSFQSAVLYVHETPLDFYRVIERWYEAKDRSENQKLFTIKDDASTVAKFLQDNCPKSLEEYETEFNKPKKEKMLLTPHGVAGIILAGEYYYGKKWLNEVINSLNGLVILSPEVSIT